MANAVLIATDGEDGMGILMCRCRRGGKAEGGEGAYEDLAEQDCARCCEGCK